MFQGSEFGVQGSGFRIARDSAKDPWPYTELLIPLEAGNTLKSLQEPSFFNDRPGCPLARGTTRMKLHPNTGVRLAIGWVDTYRPIVTLDA